MEPKQLEKIQEMSEQRLKDVPTEFHRYLSDELDWSPRLLSVRGARGVGKTTLFLQHLKKLDPRKALYVSLDSIWLSATDLHELAQHHVQHGGTHLFLDEVHYLDNWQTLLKNINDDFRGLSVAYTGSSMLQIEKSAGDLSRRLVSYDLAGMSFREYLQYEGLGDFRARPLGDILENHAKIARGIVEKLGVVLPHFETYLRRGFYPFQREAGEHFGEMLMNAVNQVLDGDYPKIEAAEPATVRKARLMLKVLADSVPQTPNVTALCRELEVDRKQGLKMLYALERAGLLHLLSSPNAKLKNLPTPEKILCGDPNVMHVLSDRPDAGTLRETFFVSQVRRVADVACAPKGDFLVGGRHLFEVGGSGKGFGQIKDVPDSYLAVDGIEVGRGARIPLWLFGFLY